MNESIENTERPEPRATPTEPSQGGLSRILGVAAILFAMAWAALIGGCFAYCTGGVALALLWAGIVGIVMGSQAAVTWPGDFAMIALAYVAVVLAIAKWSPVRPSLRVLIVALVASGAAGWLVTAIVNGFERGQCTLM
ncbi:hypothetical protein C7399_1643 [Paraburkholderia tropica]|uniref:SPW repeat-containing protein n=1 Tax=Paraburkholderia tropica TaxID=92647 RepID=A0ABX5MD93_9BURK|nr:hypothetical protein C7400_1654 [Paraburkholderia tropica]PZW68245.1 hypothetical protein C7399_1643 [Paraburkholderia tropica]